MYASSSASVGLAQTHLNHENVHNYYHVCQTGREIYQLIYCILSKIVDALIVWTHQLGIFLFL